MIEIGCPVLQKHNHLLISAEESVLSPQEVVEAPVPVPSAVHCKVISVHSRSPSPKLCLHKQTSGVINRPAASSTHDTRAKQASGATEEKTQMQAQATQMAWIYLTSSSRLVCSRSITLNWTLFRISSRDSHAL